MSSMLQPSAASDVWSRNVDSPANNSSLSGPIPFGRTSPTSLPIVSNSNLPPSTIPTIGTIPPPVPQPPRIPFPSLQQPYGLTDSFLSNNDATGQNLNSGNGFFPNNYAAAQRVSSLNPMAPNSVPNLLQNIQNEVNQRRLTRLEDESAQRRNTTSTLQQMGQQVLQGQMDIQEQVLQYQFMLDQCIESLDHQNLILNGQSEELALLHAKMRQFEFLIDAIRHSKESKYPFNNKSSDSNFIDPNLFYSRNPHLPIHAPSSMSPFFINGVTRVTSSKFQPFNPRYRSPNDRSSNANEPPSITPTVPNSNTTPSRLSRPISNSNSGS